jgi:hypothetical protein
MPTTEVYNVKKILLISTALLLASPAHARYWAAMPPVEYAVPYTGELTIWNVRSKEDMLQYCVAGDQTNWTGTGCTKVYDKSHCVIWIIKDPRIHPTIMLRHELAHCNGWSTGHAGYQKVWGDEPVKAPLLPQTTKILRAYPPLVCLTPEGKEESCTERVKAAR